MNVLIKSSKFRTSFLAGLKQCNAKKFAVNQKIISVGQGLWTTGATHHVFCVVLFLESQIDIGIVLLWVLGVFCLLAQLLPSLLSIFDSFQFSILFDPQNSFAPFLAILLIFFEQNQPITCSQNLFSSSLLRRTMPKVFFFLPVSGTTRTPPPRPRFHSAGRHYQSFR